MIPSTAVTKRFTQKHFKLSGTNGFHVGATLVKNKTCLYEGHLDEDGWDVFSSGGDDEFLDTASDAHETAFAREKKNTKKGGEEERLIK